jgi:hypothetical protein
VLRQLMVQVRWFSGAPIARHGRSPRPELLGATSSNEHLQLLGGRDGAWPVLLAAAGREGVEDVEFLLLVSY